MTTLSLDALNNASEGEFVAALDGVFEHAPWVAVAAAKERPFPGVQALFAALRRALAEAGDERRLALIRAHPELAGAAARARVLTVESIGEQAAAGLDRLSQAEYERFDALNKAYAAAFGFPFILCVRRHSRASILSEIERRTARDVDTEREAALEEVLRIAALRLHARVSGPDPLPVTGRLSTHVLDTHAGRPARGVRVELFELGEDEPDLVALAGTNEDGRTEEALVANRPLPIGRYELRFHVGEYFKKVGAPTPDPPFLDVVPVRFGVAEPEGAYHVPLLVTPWGFTTYRGS